MDIKNILISIRENRGYSKKTVSEKSGIPYTTYIKYESGERKDVSMDAIVKLADFYGVSTDYLLGRETGEPNTLDKLVGEFNMSALEKEILDNYLNLPDNMRGDLMEFLQKSVQKVMNESNGIKQIKNSEKAVARSSNGNFLEVPDEETRAKFIPIEPSEDF